MTRPALTFGALVAFGLACTVGTAWPHTAPTGWMYDVSCCSTHDCAEIANAAVRVTAEGYEVTLRPGDHMMIVWERTYRIPFGDPRIRRSGDEFFHVCIGSSTPSPSSGVEAQRMICLYVPDMGF